MTNKLFMLSVPSNKCVLHQLITDFTIIFDIDGHFGFLSDINYY